MLPFTKCKLIFISLKKFNTEFNTKKKKNLKHLNYKKVISTLRATS